MSDGKEVKRWQAPHTMRYRLPAERESETDHATEAYALPCSVVLASDHDRIVAELRAEVERYRFLYEDYSSEVEKLQHERRQLETAIATQARVIQIAKRVLHNAGLRPPDGGTPTVETICEDLNDAIKEIAAIEKEGAKDE